MRYHSGNNFPDGEENDGRDQEDGNLSDGFYGAFHALIGCSGYAASLEWLDGPATAVSAAKREISVRQFDVLTAGGSPTQSLQFLTAGRKNR